MAEAALVGTGLFAAGTAATIVTVAKYAIVVYGLYSGYRQSRAARKAYDASLTDRSITINSSDMARSIVYGERVVLGDVKYIVEPRDTAETATEAARFSRPPRPANPFFYVVLALEPAHEVESIEAVLFDGESIGPMQGNPNLNEGGTGYYVAPGSKYYKQQSGVSGGEVVVDGSGVISVPGQAITRVLSLVTKPEPVSEGSTPPIGMPVPSNARADGSVDLGTVIVDQSYAGQTLIIRYEYAISQPMVRVWYYRGTTTQQANAVLQAASGGEWNSNCRLIGTPYVIVEIRPDVDLFPGGVPNITARVKGKRCLLPQGGVSYSTNPAVHVYDYLRTAFRRAHEDINIPLINAARNACDTLIPAGYEDVTVGGPPRLPQIIYEPRYACHAILSTEATKIDNLRVLLSAMSGTLTYAGAEVDVRAGVAHDIADLSLDDGDLADERIVCEPEPNMMDGFNCVRGRFADAAQNYQIVDFPPYESPFYIAQDGGERSWNEIDLPAVTSSLQAQRIALLQLRLGRNALSYKGHYKPVLAAISAGEIVNINNETFGWVNKPFHLVQKQRRPDGSFDTVWTEAALPIFLPDYREATSPDPSPNTRLKPVDQVDKITGLTIVSGPEYSDFSDDGTIRAFALVTWDKLPADVAYGGKIELQYSFGEQLTPTKVAPLSGDATSFRIRIQRSRTLVVEVRPVNGAQVAAKEWTRASHFAADAPTEALVGNLLLNAELKGETQISRPDDDYDHAPYVPYWRGPYGVSPNGALGSDTGVFLFPRLEAFEESPGVTKARATGIAGWGADDSMDYRNQFVVSDPVSVEPGSRLLVHALVWSEWGRVKVGLEFYSSTQTFQSFGELSPPRITNSTGLDISEFSRAVLFQEVPSWAQRCRMIIQDERPPNLPSDRITVVNFTRPFLGYASAGQQTVPPWTK